MKNFIYYGNRLMTPTFSLISSALLQRGSASLYLPRFPYNTARLFNVAATCIYVNINCEMTKLLVDWVMSSVQFVQVATAKFIRNVH